MKRASRLLFVVALAPWAAAQDWSNVGGNAARNGLSTTTGPAEADLLWENDDDFSIISWAPFTEDGRVFTVRESGFPQDGGLANDALVAYDLDDGQELWRTTLPFGGDTNTEWIAWIGGVQGGQLYASRSSNGQPQPLQALDAATGDPLWESVLTSEAWAHDGLVFAPDGDPILADRLAVARIDASDGSTVWATPRSCAVSGNCGGAATDTALYIDEVAPGGQEVTKIDLATGAKLYSSPVMPGFTAQNAPFLSPDGGTVYYARSQNNPPVDVLYAYTDTGSSLDLLWSRPVRWSTSHEHGIGPDGSIYTFTQADEFVRLDPATGDILTSAGVLSPLGSPNLSAKTAVDARGQVYVSNGWASSPAGNGRLWAFHADLSQLLFTVNLDRQNAGGPALGRDGTLILCDRTAVRAYRCAAQAQVTDRNPGATNPASYSATAPVLGSTFVGTVDLSTTGHSNAALLAYLEAATQSLGGGQVLLMDVAHPAGELLQLGLQPGPTAIFSLPLPNDPALCGVFAATQAVHLGGVTPFALSNAQDLLGGL